MKSVSGRLSLSTALSRNTSLNSTYQSDTTSASVAQAERELKKLKEENGRLRKEIKEVRSLYNQLVQENSHEKFDERRIMLIKSQVIQLERQVLLMSEALSSRTETLTEVENALTWMADQWRQYISQETKSPEVPVKRSDLTQMVETAESARIKLYKNLEDTSVGNLTRPLLFVNEFVRPGFEEEITLMDIASGQLDHLNLKHIGKLETKLASLYRELISFHSVMEESEKPSLHPVSQHTNKAIQDRMATRLLKSCAMIKDCCGDLLQLSLLYPCAPWPPLKKSILKDLTCDQVMKSFPPLPKSKAKDVQKVIDSVLKACNYKHSMMNHEIKALKEDLKFHKSVYDLQMEYIQSLFDAVKGGYEKFEESTKDVIIDPLKDILKNYTELKSSASEKALKEFLSSFKQNAEKLENVVEQLSVPEDDVNGSEALTQFGEDFFYSLDKLISKCQRNRDKSVKQRSDIKEEQERLEQELWELLDEQELKYREYFSETSRTDVDELKTSKKKSPPKEVTTENITNTENENMETTKQENYFDKIEEKTNMMKSDFDHKAERKVRSVDNKKNKWNDDTNCPPTFDNLEFIYTSPKQDHKDTGGSDEDDIEFISAQIRNVSRSPEPLENNDERPVIETQKSLDVLPPVGQTKQPKKKRNYTPNLVVPNRTLQLRRSGSLSKLYESSLSYDQNKIKPQETEQYGDESSKETVKLTRSRSSSKDQKHIPQKPPFR